MFQFKKVYNFVKFLSWEGFIQGKLFHYGKYREVKSSYTLPKDVSRDVTGMRKFEGALGVEIIFALENSKKTRHSTNAGDGSATHLRMLESVGFIAMFYHVECTLVNQVA